MFESFQLFGTKAFQAKQRKKNGSGSDLLPSSWSCLDQQYLVTLSVLGVVHPCLTVAMLRHPVSCNPCCPPYPHALRLRCSNWPHSTTGQLCSGLQVMRPIVQDLGIECKGDMRRIQDSIFKEKNSIGSRTMHVYLLILALLWSLNHYFN